MDLGTSNSIQSSALTAHKPRQKRSKHTVHNFKDEKVNARCHTKIIIKNVSTSVQTEQEEAVNNPTIHHQPPPYVSQRCSAQLPKECQH